MTQIKTKLRTQLTDVPTENQLRLRTTMLEPNIELLVKNKQYKKSHCNYILNLVLNLLKTQHTSSVSVSKKPISAVHYHHMFKRVDSRIRYVIILIIIKL